MVDTPKPPFAVDDDVPIDLGEEPAGTLGRASTSPPPHPSRAGGGDAEPLEEVGIEDLIEADEESDFVEPRSGANITPPPALPPPTDGALTALATAQRRAAEASPEQAIELYSQEVDGETDLARQALYQHEIG